MNSIIWLYIIGGFFALLGAWTFVRKVVFISRTLFGTINDLASTLKDATEIARAYREDLAILRQMAQSGQIPNPGDEPESIIPQAPAAPATMPSPYWGRFATKTEEPDAPAESAGAVDVTQTEEQLVDQERNEAAVDFEVTERQKAATREADQARVKELADLGINAKPEDQ
jgi:hypothetical protein